MYVASICLQMCSKEIQFLGYIGWLLKITQRQRPERKQKQLYTDNRKNQGERKKSHSFIIWTKEETNTLLAAILYFNPDE